MQPSCTAYLDVNFDTSCRDILDNYSLTITQFSTWNPEVGTQCEPLGGLLVLRLTDTDARRGRCQQRRQRQCFEHSYTYYYISVLSTTTERSIPSSVAATPSPTQPNSITSNCDKYQIITSGDYCFIFAQNNRITVNDLADWNTVLGVGARIVIRSFGLGIVIVLGLRL
ncbi:hypothetical protein F5Y12DRAFT_712444 [Xylaria sp. FL1777]|nr:hypothetical protein F5Y12DRAFT_712444 [Xylaria sp. FL1777]